MFFNADLWIYIDGSFKSFQGIYEIGQVSLLIIILIDSVVYFLCDGSSANPSLAYSSEKMLNI